MSQESKDRSHLPAWIDELDRLRAEPNGDEPAITVTFPDNSEPLRVSRRDFLRVASVAAAAGGLGAACRAPEEKIVPYVKRRDGVYHDKPLTFSSVCDGCPVQCGTNLTVREGRVVKLEGNPLHPINRGALCARGQGSLLDLYSPERAVVPQRIEADRVSDTTWQDLDGAVLTSLKKIASGGKLRMLVDTRTGLSQLGLLEEFLSSFPDARAAIWQPLAPTAARRAAELVYGKPHLPHHRFDRARAIVSIGGAFLDVDGAVPEQSRGYGEGRNPDRDGGMSRLHVFESRLTLTGIQADRRTPIRPSDKLYVALAIAHELIVAGNVGPFASDAAVKGALTPFSAAKVAGDVGIDAEALKGAAADLKAAGAAGLAYAGGIGGGSDEVALHGVVALINESLGAVGTTVETPLASNHSGVDTAGSYDHIDAGYAGLTKLVDDLKGGVDLLIVVGVNPLYDAPAALGFEAAMTKAKLVVTVDTLMTETGRKSHFLAPASHFLESWGDANPVEHLHSVRQPGLTPLHDTRSIEECMLLWSAAAELSAASAGSLVKAAVEAHTSYKDPMGRTSPGPYFFYLQSFWAKHVHGALKIAAPFARFWEGVIREGVYYAGHGRSQVDARALYAAEAARLTGKPAPKATFGDLIKRIPAQRKTPGLQVEVELFPTIAIWDGRHAANGVLQECPDPVAQVTWGNYIAVSPKRFTEMGLKYGEVLEVKTEAGSVKAPVLFMPGLQYDTVAIPLGYGRTSAGVFGAEFRAGDDPTLTAAANDGLIGANAYALTTLSADGVIYAGFGATVTGTGAIDPVGQPQGKGQVIDLHERHLVPLATLEEYKKDKGAGSEEEDALAFWGNANKFPKDEVTWGQDHFYEKSKWEMAIDLARCTGCSACEVACQVENNIPVVGRKGVIEGRAMHWMRIDRYFKLPEREDHGDYLAEMLTQHPEIAAAQYLENPTVLVEPMLCQHCNNAPCESVCPVLATVHSDDGLNEQVYNRCVGTRYCANNCPFKVRRFNWYNYGDDRSDSFLAEVFPQMREQAQLNVKWPLGLKFNPEVTVRARGVMEKCSFCVQRIRKRSYTAKKLGIQSDAVKTACQQTCPAEAITFGDLREKDSAIMKAVNDPRSFTLLSQLNVQPGVKYMTRVRNV